MADGVLTRVRSRAGREVLSARKRGYRLVHPLPREGRRAVVLIVGCQRSGTTLMLDLFTNDWRSVTFPEQSRLSSQAEERLRLKPLPEVRDQLTRIRAGLLVLKPLVESQHVPALLEGLDDSFAIWMYRRPESVAASDLAYFGIETGERNLRLLLSNEPPNWRGEVVPEETRSVLSRFYRPGMNPYDAAALFWWARTSLFFQLGLDGRSDVRLCSYERLVSDPEPTMRSLYQYIGVPYPDQSITGLVHRKAISRGEDVDLDPEVRLLCARLWQRLEAVSARPQRDKAARGVLEPAVQAARDAPTARESAIHHERSSSRRLKT